MKRFFNFAMYCLVTVTFFLFSCSNEACFENVENKQEKVITDLEKVNQEFLSKAQSTSRGWSNWNNEERAKVVCADLTGAWNGAKAGLSFGLKAGLGIGAPQLVGSGFCALGALVGGAFSSWMAAPTRAMVSDDFKKIQNTCNIIVSEDFTINEKVIIKNDEYADNKIYISPTLIEKTRLDENSLRIAQMHNIVLSVLDGSITIEDTPTTPEEESIKNYILENEEFMDTCRAIGIRTQNGDIDSSDALSAKIINLFNEVMEYYASKTDDIAFIIGKYMEVIENSTELTSEQKESIKCGLATGLYSSNYWENRYNENKK